MGLRPSKDVAHHGNGSKPCPLCEENNLDFNPIGHLLREHQHEIGLDKTPLDSVHGPASDADSGL